MASAKEIPPGGEGRIDVTFKTERRKGVNRKQITVTTNDPGSQRVQLEVVADLEELLAASPTRQWFGQIKQDEIVTRSFVFEGKLLNDAKLSNVRLKDTASSNDAYSWKINDSLSGEQRELTLDVTVNATKIRPGRFNDILVVSTNIEKFPELDLHLSGEVLGPISATPQRLYFSQFETGIEIEKNITLSANNGQPFKILNASVNEQEFKIDPWNREASTEHSLTIRFLTESPKDRIRTALSVSTDMNAQSEIEIEIHAYQKRTRPDQRPPSTNQLSVGSTMSSKSEKPPEKGDRKAKKQ